MERALEGELAVLKFLGSSLKPAGLRLNSLSVWSVMARAPLAHLFVPGHVAISGTKPVLMACGPRPAILGKHLL